MALMNSPMVLDESQWFKMNPNGFDEFPSGLDESQWFKMNPNGFDEFPNGFR